MYQPSPPATTPPRAEEQRTPDFGHGCELWDRLFPLSTQDVHEDDPYSQRELPLTELIKEETTTMEQEVHDPPKMARRPEVESMEERDEPLKSLSAPIISSSGNHDNPIKAESRSHKHDFAAPPLALGSTVTRVITSSPDLYVQPSTGLPGYTQESSNAGSRTSLPLSMLLSPIIHVDQHYDHALDSTVEYPHQNMWNSGNNRQGNSPNCQEAELDIQARGAERLTENTRSIEHAIEGNASHSFAPIIHDFALDISPIRNGKEDNHRGGHEEQDHQHFGRTGISLRSDTSPLHVLSPKNIHADENTEADILSPSLSVASDSDDDPDGYTPLLSDDPESESPDRSVSDRNDLPVDDIQHDPKQASPDQATSSSSDDRWLALTFEYKTMKDNARYHQVVRDCLHSETIFDSCISYCKGGENGKEFADAILCTMQQVITIFSDQPHGAHDNLQMLHDRYGLTVEFGNDSLHSFRRTMLKLSVNTQVIPSTLFLRGIQCTETEPRVGGGYADVFYGSAPGQAVALKRLRIFHATSYEKYSIVSVAHSLSRERCLSPYCLGSV